LNGTVPELSCTPYRKQNARGFCRERVFLFFLRHLPYDESRYFARLHRAEREGFDAVSAENGIIRAFYHAADIDYRYRTESGHTAESFHESCYGFKIIRKDNPDGVWADGSDVRKCAVEILPRFHVKARVGELIRVFADGDGTSYKQGCF
jgi:hypothetical protein